MSNYRLWLSMLLMGSISLGNFSCSSDGDDNSLEMEKTVSPIITTEPEVDLSQVFEKRIEGKNEEAIALLRSLNEKHPASIEVMIQLARTLLDAQQFPLAAFRFEQALSLKSDHSLAKEAAEAHYLSRDFDSAIERYRQYLSTNPNDSTSQLRFARLLADKGHGTESLNAFSKASNEATADDCLVMGNLFLQKNLLPQAKHWYTEASRRTDHSPTKPLMGLLKVAKTENKEEEAETIILALEKLDPGILEPTNMAEYSADLLRRRRLADFIARGMDARGKSVSELASGLLAGKANLFRQERSVTSGSKLPPPRDLTPSPTLPPIESSEKELEKAQQDAPTASQESFGMSLADAFAAPLGQIKDVSGASDSPLDLGQKAYLEGSYTSALLHARDALKKNPKDASAWRLCSQSHFQLGEINQAEMTILEAIRHQPFDLDLRMDYLRIARETLPSKRYLQELEKVRDMFPESTEILWELARRYHIVENMPVTAAVLYRKIVQTAPPNSAIAEQAELELVKLRER